MKVLISADIHIGDYRDYNYSYRSRLNQFNKLATRLVELGHRYKCEEHWILGDLIDKPNSRKYIEHVARRFLKVQSESFSKVRFILGQHDKDSKSQDFNQDDTLLTMFDYSNCIYMDKKLLELDGHKFAFMDWTKEQSLDWLTTHVDVLFGHYTKSSLFGQDIDDTRFDLMIHGDIHNDQVIGKFVSVGNPIQKDMDSLSNGSCIIFDTETLNWERIRVDEDHTRFLRMEYTDDPNKEGFHGELQYYIYVPPLDSTFTEEDKTITWNNIEELIVNTCKEYNLLDIHDEVLTKCVPYSEIDFNFQLKRLSIHGYRSIVDLEVDFEHGDRIALLGENGSGKSSVLSAIQSVFERNHRIMDEQSDFTDYVSIKLSFVYQNKLYEITKGSDWGFTIDGNELAYNNMTEFEKDLRVKLPFIDYLDLFFIKSNVQNLSNQFNPTRRIELISKFYRLDRIDAYYQTVCDLWTEVDKVYWETDAELNTQMGILNHIKNRLSELEEFKDKSRDDVQSKLDGYQILRDKNQARQLWLRDKSSKLNRLNEQKLTVDGLKSKLAFDVEQGKVDLIDLQKKAEDTNSSYEATFKTSVEFESELKEIKLLEERGAELGPKLEALKSGICPECGNKLTTGSSKELYEKYQDELEKCRLQWLELDAKLDSYPRKRDSKDYYIKLLRDVKSAYKDLMNGIELLKNKINTHEIHKNQLKVEQLKLDKLQDEYDKFLQTEPEQVELPLEISKLESDAAIELARIDEYNRELKSKSDQELKIKDLETLLEGLAKKRSRYDEYSQLTSNTGRIYEEILRKLAVKFSTREVKYEVESGIYRGKNFINLNSYYLVKKKYRIYEKCSDGQKTVCDLDFLNKLFSINVGVLVLDEHLKHLDDINFPHACEILKDMNVNTIIISTHDDNMTAYSKRILLSLNDNGETVYSVQ